MPGQLILLCGRPGTGKTTLAKALARKINAVYLDKDDIAEPLCPNDRVSEKYLSLHFPIYDALLTIAETNLALGQNVIIDSPFTQLMGDESFITKLKRISNGRLKIFRTFCTSEVNRERLISRGLVRDKDKVSPLDFETHLLHAPMLFTILTEHTNINTEETLEIQLDEIITTL